MSRRSLPMTRWGMTLLIIAVTLFSQPRMALPVQAATPVNAESVNARPVAQGDDQPVDSLSDLESAVVQIEAVGTFVDPAEGLQLNAAGRGSGFIIDPSGIAVTNNHVVTGGGLYKVYVAGEEEPRSAKVLGVSECADLAVIDIQGDGFPYVEWYEGAIKVGLDVYAAGFPLGDPEFTMTRGIVAKEKANGKTSWASVSKVIQHDATINPGNSGGPLVDENGKVVAVNYAGNSETNQYFAISRDEAVDIIEQLRAGENIDTIGINGEAVSDGQDLSGIWVSSVKSGSPADKVGIQPGDILLSLEGITLAEDGTMATYCDVLRSHDPSDVLAVQVMRFETKEVLEGQLNGRELAQSFSFADQLEEQNAGSGSQATAGEAYSEYTTVSDRSGILSVEVPVEWADVSDGDWTWQEEPAGIRLVATTDADKFFDSWQIPGVIFNVSTSLAENNTPEDLLDAMQYTDSCTYEGREAIPEGFYTGFYDIWSACDNSDSRAIVASVVPETQDFIVLFEIYLVTEADVDALDHILDSFVVNLESAPSGNQGNLNEDIFSQVDVSGLTYDYALVGQPALSAILPADWSDIASDDWVDEDDQPLGKTLYVSPDIQEFQDTWSMAGLYVRSATGLEEELDITDLLDSVDLTDKCTYDERYEHSHTINDITYNGAYDLYTNCDDEENAFAYLVAQSEDLSHAVFIEFLAVTEADAEAFDVLLQSFYIDPAATGENTENSTGTEETAYTLITDDTETLTVRVPAEWTDVSSGDWVLDEEVIGVSLKAAIDLEEYDDSWTAPGLFFGVSEEFASADTKEVLDNMDYSENCQSSERFEYDDSVFVGHYDLWEGCGGSDESLWVILIAQPKENADYLVLLNVLLPQKADITALDEIFKSFNVAGSSSSAEDAPTAEVTTNALNIRSGPGTNYERLGSLGNGDQVVVLGQYNNCDWLNVQTRDEVTGWISGNERYVTLDTDCADIPEAEAPAPPSNSGSGGASGGQRPAPAAPASTKGCYLFQNELGAELNITFTRKGDGWNNTFKVGEGAEVQQCFDPGDYTYTLDAPPPWGSTNGELTINAGDNYTFPIRPE